MATSKNDTGVVCYTCFPYGNNTILCNTGKDDTKFVREFMHPTDDVKSTLWLFNAKIKCMFNANKKEFDKDLLNLFNRNPKDTIVEYVNADEYDSK